MDKQPLPTHDERGLAIAQKIAVLTGRHLEAVAIVLHPDTLDLVKAWASGDDGLFFGKSIITSEDLSVGTVLIAY